MRRTLALLKCLIVCEYVWYVGGNDRAAILKVPFEKAAHPYPSDVPAPLVACGNHNKFYSKGELRIFCPVERSVTIASVLFHKFSLTAQLISAATVRWADLRNFLNEKTTALFNSRKTVFSYRLYQ